MWPQARQPRAKVYLSGLAWLRFRLGRGVRVEVIYVTPVHRFGNAVHQLGNATTVAERAAVNTVVIGKNEIFTAPAQLGSSRNLATTLPRARRWWRGQAILVGRFFWGEEFPGVCSDEAIPKVLFGLADSFINRERLTWWDSETLVVHVRGGDVFQTPAPRKYGQPPLSFYTAIISSRPWKQIVVVSEDRRNPVVDGVVAYCHRHGIPCEHQSEDLLSDLHVLFGAANLVIAAGSFGRALIVCSEAIRNVYEFESTGFLYPLPPGVAHCRVVDYVGDYRKGILAGNWNNTEEQ